MFEPCDPRRLSPSPALSRSGRLTAVLLAGLSALVLVSPVLGAAHRPLDGSPEAEVTAVAGAPAGFEHAAVTDDGRIQVVVELQDPPAAVVFAQALKGAKPSDTRALAAAGAASKAQALRNQAAQDGV